jgi:hypothetical protein
MRRYCLCGAQTDDRKVSYCGICGRYILPSSTSQREIERQLATNEGRTADVEPNAEDMLAFGALIEAGK